MRRALLLVASLLAASAALAQDRAEQTRALAAAQRAAIAAGERSRQLEAQSIAARELAAAARAAAAATAARVQAAEADIAQAQARLATLAAARRAAARRLDAQRGPVVRLAAALQTMARRPPALALVQPGSIGEVVHTRGLLAAALPAVRARTAALRAELAAREALRIAAADAVARLRDGQARLARERLALVRLEAESRRRSRTYADDAMFEQDRVVALGEEARDIVELIGEIDVDARVRERLAALPGPLLRPTGPVPVRLPAAAPAPPPRPAPLDYRLPVVGTLVTGLGEISEAGVRTRGLTLRPRPGAQVVAPAAGRIAYAGPFRGYGAIAIVDHGGGWTSLVTGLDRLGVAAGDRVDRGSPLGRAAAARPLVTVELRRGGMPVDIVRLLGG